MVDPNKLSVRKAAILFSLVLCGLLLFGLWPFGSPRNQVTWLHGQHGVRFGEHGTILSMAPLEGSNSNACSVEMWLRPASTDASNTFLAFYDATGTVGLSLHQSLADLRVDYKAVDSTSNFYAGDFFQAGKLVFLSVISEPNGTKIYLDGSLVKPLPAGQPSRAACSGRFVVGDSPRENDSWEGDLEGLAIYTGALTPEDVASDYQSWKGTGHPAARTPTALYLFDESTGNTIRDCGLSGLNLSIPARYMIVRQILLETPWSAFEPTIGYVKDVLINIGGFVPFGVTCSALLVAFGKATRVSGWTVLFGFLVSLTIEALQSRLPTRSSDLTDVLTNTLGASLGAITYRHNFCDVNGLIRLVGA